MDTAAQIPDIRTMDLARLKEGEHVGQFVRHGNVGKKRAEYATRAVAELGIDDWIADNPVTKVEFVKDIGRIGLTPIEGRYRTWTDGSNHMEIATRVGDNLYGHPFVAGKTWGVSRAATNQRDYLQRTFTHEFGHHVFRTMEGDLRPAVSKLLDKGRYITEYAGTGESDYFAETFAAYVHERAALQVTDPDGFAMIDAVVNQMGGKANGNAGQ